MKTVAISTDPYSLKHTFAGKLSNGLSLINSAMLRVHRDLAYCFPLGLVIQDCRETSSNLFLVIIFVFVCGLVNFIRLFYEFIIFFSIDTIPSSLKLILNEYGSLTVLLSLSFDVKFVNHSYVFVRKKPILKINIISYFLYLQYLFKEEVKFAPKKK